MRRLLPVLPLVIAAGCTNTDAYSGYVWDVTVTSTEDTVDTCNDPPQAYSDSLEFVLNFDGSSVDLAIGADTFATGTISGCRIEYESPVVIDLAYAQEGYDVKWQLDGWADYEQAAGACDIADDYNWLGEETFTVVSSDHPDIEANCYYTLEVSGTYGGPVGDP